MTQEADDLDRPVWGIKAFSEIIDRTERQTYHLIASGKLPANKVGERYVSTKRKLLGALLGETAA